MFRSTEAKAEYQVMPSVYDSISFFAFCCQNSSRDQTF